MAGIEVDESLLRNFQARGGIITDADGNELSSDDSFLNDYVDAKSDPSNDKAALKQVLSEIGGSQDENDLQSQLDDIDAELATSDKPSDVKALKVKRQKIVTQLTKIQKIQKTIDNKGIVTDRTSTQQQTEDAQGREDLRREQNTRDNAQLQKVNDAKEIIGDKAHSVGTGLVNKISSLPTLGSLGLLVALLVLLLFVVVSVDGKGTTRIKQIWFMLLGKASLTGRVDVVKGSQGGQASSGNTIDKSVNGGSPSLNNTLGGLVGLPPIVAGKLPSAKAGTAINYQDDYTGQSNQLNRDLIIGSLNLKDANPGDIAAESDALLKSAQLGRDFNAKNTGAIAGDVNALQKDLNELNQKQLNGDYDTIYRGLGF